MTIKNLMRCFVVVVFVFFNSAANAMVCNSIDAAVDWLGVGFDSTSGSCNASATVTDGVGTASSVADISGDTISLNYQFATTGTSVFIGDMFASVSAEFTIGTGGGKIIFNNTAGPNAFGEYQLSGPGVASFGEITGELLLSTSGLYQLEMNSNIGFSALVTPYVGGFTATVETVPIPSAVWLFGSGLLGLIGVARRKKV